MYLPTRSQVALGNGATKRLSLIIVFIERDNARPVGVSGRVGLTRVAGLEAVAGAFLLVHIPEIAALPDAVAQAGERADGGGVVSHHILRIMAGSARPTFSVKHRRDACSTGLPYRATRRVAPTLFNLILFGYVMSCAKDLNIFGY